MPSLRGHHGPVAPHRRYGTNLPGGVSDPGPRPYGQRPGLAHLDPARLALSGLLMRIFSSQFSGTTMKNKVLKLTAGVLLMSGSALAFAREQLLR